MWYSKFYKSPTDLEKTHHSIKHKSCPNCFSHWIADSAWVSYVIRQLQPWFENIKKRQVKAPKIYIRDVGLLHNLLFLNSFEGILGHPKYGASWEGFALEQVLNHIEHQEAYYWATYTGAELDLLIIRNGKRYGFEFKCSDAPKITKSMQIALNDIKLENISIIYPGNKSYLLSDKIKVLSILDLDIQSISSEKE